MITLTAKRINGETHFFNPDGSLKAKIPAYQKQLNRRTKQTTLNCWKYNLKWK